MRFLQNRSAVVVVVAPVASVATDDVGHDGSVGATQLDYHDSSWLGGVCLLSSLVSQTLEAFVAQPTPFHLTTDGLHILAFYHPGLPGSGCSAFLC